MKILLPSLTKLPNLEYFQLMSDTRDIVFYVPGQHGEPVQGTLQMPVSVLEPFRAPFTVLYDRLDAALLKIATEELTVPANIAERTRDEVIIGFRTHVKAFSYSLEEAKREAARKLQIVFNSFGDFQNLSNNKQTAAAYNFLQEMEVHADNVALIGAQEWVEAISKTNEDFVRLMSQRLDDRTAKATEEVRAVRQEMDIIFRQMMSFLEISITLNSTPELTDLINRLNKLMTLYRNTLAQRLGAAKAKKDKESSEQLDS